MFRLDAPAAADPTTIPLFFLMTEPTTAVVSFARFVAAHMILGQPAKSWMPDVTSLVHADRKRRMPALIVLLVSEDLARRFVIRIFPQNVEKELIGDRRLLVDPRLFRQIEQAVGIFHAISQKLFVPLHDFQICSSTRIGGVSTGNRKKVLPIGISANDPLASDPFLLGQIGLSALVRNAGQLSREASIQFATDISQIIGRRQVASARDQHYGKNRSQHGKILV